jgi:hypothetical protein
MPLAYWPWDGISKPTWMHIVLNHIEHTISHKMDHKMNLQLRFLSVQSYHFLFPSLFACFFGSFYYKTFLPFGWENVQFSTW